MGAERRSKSGPRSQSGPVFCRIGIWLQLGVNWVAAAIFLGAPTLAQERDPVGDLPWLDARYRGSWTTLVSGRRDALTAAKLQEIIAQARSVVTADAAERASLDSWIDQWEAWIRDASGPMVDASAYMQTEHFVAGDGCYYQRNIHGGGFRALTGAETPEQLASLARHGEIQNWRWGQWRVYRSTFTGLDDQVVMFANDPSEKTVPQYVLLTDSLLKLRGHIKARGERGAGPGVTIWEGPAPSIVGVQYPPWYDMTVPTFILTERGGSHGAPARVEITMRGLKGVPIMELVGIMDGPLPRRIRRTLMFPFSSVAYNEVDVQVLEKAEAEGAFPSLADVLTKPFPATELLDNRNRALVIPMSVALEGPEAVEEFVRNVIAEAWQRSGVPDVDGAREKAKKESALSAGVALDVHPPSDDDPWPVWILGGLCAVAVALAAVLLSRRRR